MAGFELYHWVGKAVEIMVIGYALIAGRSPERIGGAALLVAIVVTPLSQDLRFLPGPQWGLAAVDSLYLLALIWILARWRRTWAIYASAAQLLVVTCHVVLMFDRTIDVWIYIATMNLLGYAMMAALAWGVWRDRRPDSAPA